VQTSPSEPALALTSGPEIKLPVYAGLSSSGMILSASLLVVRDDHENRPIPDPLRPPLPQDCWFATPTQPKTAIAIISGTAKAIKTANLADTFKGSIRTKAHPEYAHGYF